MSSDEVYRLSANGYYHGNRINGKVEETHISWVILTRKLAFKIKKPVTLSFLDFSTLRLRKKYCNRELVLNKRTTDIYLRVEPVCRFRDDLYIGRKRGSIVDYAVVMKRMATSRKMDHMLDKGVVSKRAVARLALFVAGFHRDAPVVDKPFLIGERRRVFNDWETIAGDVGRILGPGYARIIHTSNQWSDHFLRVYRARFDERTRGGFVRDVHGDLHCGNVFLYRRPVIFDCIEFNDSFREIDLLYEIAFICMELETRDRSLHDVFLKSYLGCIDCFTGQRDYAIFDYFKCLRANIRAKVEFLECMNTVTAGDSRRHIERCKRYMKMVEKYING